jgi:predicted TIM-barrel fold metal-dependent hydrolase
MKRRTFLTAAASAVALSEASSLPAQTASVNGPLIDTNVSLSQWPIRHSWAPTPAALVQRLKRHGVTSAWTGTFDGVLHTDMSGANARLAETCRRDGAGILVPMGTVNPSFPDWEDDVRRCHEVHGMRGLRLYPNYHGYALDDPRFTRLLAVATQRRLIVQIMLSIEDDRSQNPMLTALPVQAGPLVEILPKISGARVMLLNGGSRVLGGNVSLLHGLVSAGVTFEIATLEGVAGIENLLKRAPGVRTTFGSHSPYFYFESALLKLQESALSPADLEAVRSGNAGNLLLS